MSSDDSKRVSLSQILLPFRKLPNACPSCHRRIQWGWLDDDLSAPTETEEDAAVIRMLRIRRPDQTLFCPQCEERILN
jgi:hypothetical protein